MQEQPCSCKPRSLGKLHLQLDEVQLALRLRALRREDVTGFVCSCQTGVARKCLICLGGHSQQRVVVDSISTQSPTAPSGICTGMLSNMLNIPWCQAMPAQTVR